MSQLRSAAPRRFDRLTTRWSGALAFAAGLALMIALSLAAARWDRFPGDLELARAIQWVHLPGLSAASEGAYLLAARPAAAATLVVFFLLFLLLRRRLEAAMLATAVGPALLTDGLKHLVGRPRPEASLLRVAHDYSTGSFPSAHVVYWVVVYGLLFVLVPVVLPRTPWRRLARGMLLAVIVFGGFSRVYLGDHWPSDVLGGYLLGSLLLATILAVYHALRSDRATPAA